MGAESFKDAGLTDEELEFIENFEYYSKSSTTQPVRRVALYKRPLLYGSLLSLALMAVAVVALLFFFQVSNVFEVIDSASNAGVTRRMVLGEDYSQIRALYSNRVAILASLFALPVAVLLVSFLADRLVLKKLRKQF